MKVTELMLDDWVTGKKWREKPFQITRINDNGRFIYGKTAENSIVGPFLPEELEPIPVTPDRLKAIGFKEYEEDYHNEYVCEKKDGTGYYEVVISWRDSYDNGALDAFNHVQWDEGWRVNIEGGEGSYNKGWCKTIYFHEVQHALHACGLSKLADSFKVENISK